MTIPNIEPDPAESGRRNRAAIRYLNHCGILRTEPNKHRIMNILLGKEESDGSPRAKPDWD